MELPAQEIRRVRLSALLHDVGKIGIDDRILRKPSALTEEEFEIMKTHRPKPHHVGYSGAEDHPGMKHPTSVEGGGFPRLAGRGHPTPGAHRLGRRHFRRDDDYSPVRAR